MQRRNVAMFFELRRRFPLSRLSYTLAGWWVVYILASAVVFLFEGFNRTARAVEYCIELAGALMACWLAYFLFAVVILFFDSIR